MYEQEQEDDKFIEPKRARRIRDRVRIEIRRSRNDRDNYVPEYCYTRKRKHNLSAELFMEVEDWNKEDIPW